MRREDGKTERTYASAVERISITGGKGPAVTQAQQAAAAATLRLTARELARAIGNPRLRRKGRTREVVAMMRGKAWLGAADLRTLDEHVRAIEALLRSRATRRPRTRVYAVSVVLAPAGAREEAPE